MKKILSILNDHPVISILALGGIVRLIFLLSYYSSPDWEQLIVDSLYHHRWAKAIAGGDILGGEVFVRAPLYIYLLGGLYSIFGYSLLVGRILGIAIGLLSIRLTYLIGIRLFDKRTAIIAGIIHAIYPIVIYFESELLVDSLFMLFVELSIFIFLLALDRKRLKYFVLTGLIIGLAAITRPVILGMVPLYLIWIIISVRQPGQVIRSCLIILFMMVLVIAPVTIRNAIVSSGGDFVPIVSSAGINFFIGNNAEADGITAVVPPLGNNWEMQGIKKLAEDDVGGELLPSELSDYWFGRGKRWILDNPDDFIKLYVRKLYFTINNYEVSNNRFLPTFFDDFVILKYNPLGFGLVFSLAVVGLFYLFISGRINRPKWFLLLYVVLYLLLTAMFFMNARFRLPVLPFIFIFSACGIKYLSEIVYGRKFETRQIAIVVPGFLVLFLSFSNIYGINKADTSSAIYNRANHFMRTGDFERASMHYKKLLEQNDLYDGANLNYGVSLLRQGILDSARYYLKRELKINGGSAEAHANLAVIAFAEKRYADCWMLSLQAIRLKPDLNSPYIFYFRSVAEVRDSTGLGEMLFLGENNLKFKAAMYYEAGLLFSAWYMSDMAQVYFNKVLDSREAPIETEGWLDGYSGMDETALNQFKAKAAFQLGYIYGTEEKIDSSIIFCERAIALDSNLVEAYINLANFYMISGQRNNAARLLLIARSRFPTNDVFIRMQNSL